MSTTPARLPAEVAERVLAQHPSPIADAVAALLAADGPYEQRDRVVEAFRAWLRTVAALVLAARVQFGPGPGAGAESAQAQLGELLRALRSRGLTDGQWQALVRETLRPWSGGGAHPLVELVELVHARKAELPKLVDELLVMRKSETVAHGATGTKEALAQILERRVPQLAKILEACDALWRRVRIVLPLARPSDDGDAQGAWLLAGDTPGRGRWRRVELAPGVRAEPGEALLVDAGGKPLVALHPLVLVRRPSPEAVEEVFFLDGGGKRGAVYVAFPSMAEHREADAWKALERALSDDEPAPASSEVPAGERPYRGLASFGPEHAALFFGREEQTEALANRIRRHPIVTVTGPSGSGKTSLLRAGVLPELGDARQATMRPGSEPVENLASALGQALAGWKTEQELAALIKTDPSAIGPLLIAWSRETSLRLVLLVDQTEEVFTLCADAKARDAFALALASIEGEIEGPTRVVLSLREDFFGRLATLPALRGLYSRQVEVVTTPDRDALARTLVAPAKHFGYAFEDEALVWTMVDAVQGEPAALALLSFCADRLWDLRDRTWKRLTAEAYKAVGGVAGALATHADALVGELSAAQLAACRSIFLRLVTGERTRAVARRSELVEASASPETAAAVLDRLVAGRLVTTHEAHDDAGASGPGVAAKAAGAPEASAQSDARVEIVHEALIRHWGLLATWLGEDEEGQRLAHALRQAAREWEARGRSKSLLWRGDVLAEYRRWRARGAEALTGVEAAFASASEAEERRGRRVRRSLVGAALAATSAFGVAMFFQRQQALHAEQEASGARVRAEVRGLVAEARSRENEHAVGAALALLRAATALEATVGERDETPVSVDLARLERAGAAARVLPHSAAPWLVALSPDGTRLATAVLDGTARIWDVPGGTLRAELAKHPGAVRSIAWSPDGTRLASASSDAKDKGGVVRLWDATSGAMIRELLDLPASVAHVAFSPEGGWLAAGTSDGGVYAWRVATLATGAGVPPLTWQLGAGVSALAFAPTGQRLAALAGKTLWLRDLAPAVPHGAGRDETDVRVEHERGLLRLAFAPDGGWVAAGDQAGAFVIADAATGKARDAPKGHDKRVSAIAASPDGAWIGSGAADGSVHLAPAGGGEIRTLSAGKGEIASVAFSRDGKLFAAVCDERAACVWDVATGARLATLEGHEGYVGGVLFGNDGRWLATHATDKTVRIWSLDAPGVDVVRKGHAEPALFLAPAGRDRWVSASQGHLVGWSLPAWTPTELRGQTGAIRALGVGADGDLVVTGALDGSVRVWSGASPERRLELPGTGKPSRVVAVAPDGGRFAVGGAEGSVRLFDAKTGAPAGVLEGHTGPVAGVAFSPDGKLLATASWDKTARLWDVASAKVVATLDGYEGWVSGVAFSPDGKLVATLANLEARLYRVDGAALLHRLTGHEQAVLGGAFAPDGSFFATASADGTVRTFRVDDGSLLRTLHSDGVGLQDLAIAPGGDRIAAAAGNGVVRVWHATTGQVVDTWQAHGKSANVVAFSAAGDRVVTVGADGLLVSARTARLSRGRSLSETGARTNLRVCRATFAVVPVAPPPEADTVWAPDAACATPR